MPDSDTQESFLRDARKKGWVEKFLLHSSGEKEENYSAMEQYLSKYLFEKYEYEAFFPASQCGLPVRTSMKPKLVATMVDDANITLTNLKIIFNYIRYEFGKRDILTKEAVQNLGTGMWC